MSKLIVELPDELHGALKKKAVTNNKTIKEVITELVNAYISSSGKNQNKMNKTGICGTWNDERTADEIIKDIKEHRSWFRQRKG
jgi:hypothetical protein